MSIGLDNSSVAPTKRGASLCELRRRIGRFISGQHVLSIADQAVVSATSFVTLVIFARSTSPEETGFFALAISVAMAAIAMQHALVSQPYLIAHGDDVRAERATASLVFAGLTNAGLIVLLLAAALALPLLGGSHTALTTTLSLAWIVPAILAKELMRNFALSHLEMRRAVIIDIATSVLQITALACLVSMSQLTLLSGLAVMGGASLVIGGSSLFAMRSEFRWSGVPVQQIITENWLTGKWFAASRLAHLVQGYVTLWITALVDIRLTAVLAACLSIVGLANPVVQGLYNALAPQAVLAWRSKGAKGLHEKSLYDLGLLTFVMTMFCIVIVLAGESAIQFLYPAPEYRGYGHVASILAVGALAAALGIPASNGLATIGEARSAARITATIVAIHCVLVPLAMSRYGLLGAAYATLFTSAGWTALRWIAFVRFNRAQ